MKAATHTEVYRPFRGELRQYPKRALTLAWSGVRIGFRKKLPALLLFTIPAILTIYVCFIVKLMFEAQNPDVAGELGMQKQILGTLLAEQMGEVEVQTLNLIQSMQAFVVLAVGWYGSGLIAEDKRLRANLLYFARPVTRWTYFLGKLGTVMFWGMCAVGLPVLLVCGTAATSSPNWAFLTERWDVILKLEAYAILWVFVHGILVLAISSICERRNQALAGLFGFYILTTIGSRAMSKIFDGAAWKLVSIPENFQRISDSMFGLGNSARPWKLEASLWPLGILVFVCAAILHTQIRKMEVGR
jgi:ABC-type transport system involved in multi-copper enzyme maturation permease subunit